MKRALKVEVDRYKGLISSVESDIARDKTQLQEMQLLVVQDEEFESRKLNSYAELLTSQAVRFDMISMETTLEDFGSIFFDLPRNQATLKK